MGAGNLMFVLLITLVTTMLAGFIPRGYCRLFAGAESQGGGGPHGYGRRGFAEALIVFQFTISLVFIIGRWSSAGRRGLCGMQTGIQQRCHPDRHDCVPEGTDADVCGGGEETCGCRKRDSGGNARWVLRIRVGILYKGKDHCHYSGRR